MIKPSKSLIMKSFLLLSCAFYFILLSLTAFGIAYSVHESQPEVVAKYHTVNYCKQVIIPVNKQIENYMFMREIWPNPLRISVQ